MRGWKKIFHANGNNKKVGAAILTSGNTDFKPKSITKVTGHCIMKRGSMLEEDIILIIIYA